MMLTIRDCKILREAYSPNSGLTVDEAGRLIGNPTDATLIGYACEQMNNPDRNVRVLMLRLLAHQTGAQAAHGVLSGLCDEQRRVCAVAIQACANYLYHDEVVRQLVSIATDRNRKRKLRRRALSMLSGDEGRWKGDLTTPVFAALSSLIQEDELRFTILFGLLRLEIAPRIESLLVVFNRVGRRIRALACKASACGRARHPHRQLCRRS